MRGACLIEVHLHEKSFGGNVKWPFKTGAHLIQVAAATGGTVRMFQVSFQIMGNKDYERITNYSRFHTILQMEHLYVMQT